jgi:hypothetical protein
MGGKPQTTARFKNTSQPGLERLPERRFLRQQRHGKLRSEPGEFAKVQFQKLEETIYGVPIYRQPWFRARRQKLT